MRFQLVQLTGSDPAHLQPVRGAAPCQVVERRDYKPRTYEQARPQLYKELFEQRAAEQYQSFVGKLREQTYIERKGVYAEAQPPLSSKPLE